MSAPKDPARPNPELDYAPPWVRENIAREDVAHEKLPPGKVGRENATRANMARENMAREQSRPPLGERAPGENQEANEIGAGGSRKPSDDRPYDRPWHHRALEPELVPEPPEAAPNFWPTMLRLGIVCAIAAIVAAAVVLLFNPKQGGHKGLQANDPSLPSVAENSTMPAVGPAQIVPALTAGKPASITGTPVQPQPQGVGLEPQAVAPATPIEPPVNPDAPIPPVNPPAREASRTPETPPTVQAAAVPELGSANSGAVKQSLAKPAVTLDNDEISSLIRRGNALLKDGDFAAARLLFERAADAGSAEAALALGSTYDPVVIKRLGAIAVRPDIENARKWYQIAVDRGSAAAKLQLANLPPSR